MFSAYIQLMDELVMVAHHSKVDTDLLESDLLLK